MYFLASDVIIQEILRRSSQLIVWSDAWNSRSAFSRANCRTKSLVLRCSWLRNYFDCAFRSIEEFQRTSRNFWTKPVPKGENKTWHAWHSIGTPLQLVCASRCVICSNTGASPPLQFYISALIISTRRSLIRKKSFAEIFIEIFGNMFKWSKLKQILLDVPKF